MSAIKKLGFAVSAIGRISPKLAAKTFLHFFSHPPKRAFRHHHLALKKAAQVGDLTLTTYPFSQQLVNVKTYTWGTGEKRSCSYTAGVAAPSILAS